MPMFKNEYPYTNIHEINLDWVIKNVQEIRAMVDKYIINYEQITFADPISWEYAVAYPLHTIVLDQSYNAYLSKQDVPSYTQLGDSDYWLKIGDFFKYSEKARSNIAYNEGANATASKSYAVGDLLINNDILYRALIQMPAGSTFVIGTNIEEVTVETLLNDLKGDYTEKITTLRSDMNTGLMNLENLIGSHINEINRNHQIKTYDSIADIGVSAANATIVNVYNALPVNSVIYVNSSELLTGTTPADGIVEIMKMSDKAFIRFNGTDKTAGFWIMGFTNNVPDGYWHEYIGYKTQNITPSVTGVTFAGPIVCTKSGNMTTVELTYNITVDSGYNNTNIFIANIPEAFRPVNRFATYGGNAMVGNGFVGNYRWRLQTDGNLYLVASYAGIQEAYMHMSFID